MQTVTVTRSLDADPDRVRAAIGDVGPFMEAAGFDDVSLEGDLVRLTNRVGLATMELTLEVVDDPDAALAYEQREGIFREMRTTYDVTATDGASEVRARTAFALDVALVGGVLDATVIKRQRRKEIESQFDWLERKLEE